jgi:hypothetical protein
MTRTSGRSGGNRRIDADPSPRDGDPKRLSLESKEEEEAESVFDSFVHRLGGQLS